MIRKSLVAATVIVLIALFSFPAFSQITSGTEEQAIVTRQFSIVGQTLNLWSGPIFASGNSTAIANFALAQICYKSARVDINNGNWKQASYNLQKTLYYLSTAIKALG